MKNQEDLEFNASLNEAMRLVRDLEERRNEEFKKTQTFLFVSYDIVNSTKYKTICKNWFIELTKILNYIKHMILDKKDLVNEYFFERNVRLWKQFGDEVIFIVAVDDIKKLPNLIKKFYQVLQSTCDYIKNPFSDFEISELLSVKSTAWITVASGTPCKDIRNFWQPTYASGKVEPPLCSLDFAGPEIDTGFRISKETAARQMVLSYELAYILLEPYYYYENFPNVFAIHIKTFLPFKGVWYDSEYPVLWYFDKRPFGNQVSHITDIIEQSKLELDETPKRKQGEELRDINQNTFNVLKKIGEIERPRLEKDILLIKENAKECTISDY